MRAFTITFSSIAFALLLVLGAVFNVFSGLQIDVPTPYNYPARVVGTLLGETPGLIFALVGLGYALYDAAQRHATRWFIALLVWPVIPLLAANLMFAGALSYAPLWFTPLALIPLGTFVYGLIAAPLGPRPAPLAPAPRRYITFVGFLGAVTIALGALLLTPPPSSVVGPVPVSPPVLQVDPLRTNATCAHGIYPQITLGNVGSQTIHWTAQSQDGNVTITPANGTLAPNTETRVTVEGASSARQVNIQFTPDIGTGSITEFLCQ
jgi:hypothetical protein